MGKKKSHSLLCTCKSCCPLILGSLTNGYGSTKDTGGRKAKRQTNKNHDTNRKGGGQQR